jgi:Aminotransferase class I and II
MEKGRGVGAGIRRAVEELGAKAVWLTSPNNPTGNLIEESELRKVLELDALVVLDEAYIEVRAPSPPACTCCTPHQPGLYLFACTWFTSHHPCLYLFACTCFTHITPACTCFTHITPCVPQILFKILQPATVCCNFPNGPRRSFRRSPRACRG